MPATQADFSVFVDNITREFNETNWGYGQMTVHLRAMYLIDIIDKILTYMIGNKLSHNIFGIILLKIDEIEKYLSDYNNNKLFEKFIKINTTNVKLTKYKYIRYFGNDSKKQKDEYEELVKQCNPFYTILVNKRNSKTLRQFPDHLIRYMNDFL